ncbi:MAG TPA: 50S ribosomal protein L24 [Crocinitomicaceae bacterium]|nr:50S ribosomal protein L24 [Crocinitomicaceae bacterium]
MKTNFKIKKGDTVQVIAGAAKDGAVTRGVVLDIDTKKQRVFIEGLTKKVQKHVKPQTDKVNPDGGIIEKDYAVHISNVMLVDPTSGDLTRVGYKFDENGKKVRFAKKSGETI